MKKTKNDYKNEADEALKNIDYDEIFKPVEDQLEEILVILGMQVYGIDNVLNIIEKLEGTESEKKELYRLIEIIERREQEK